MSLLRYSHSLASLNTFGLEVLAACFAAPSTLDELKEAGEASASMQKTLCIGEGSNLLFLNDFDGLVLKPLFTGIEILEETEEEVLVKVGAAENWDAWVEEAVSRGWYGLENLSLIPGTVGAAPVQNIGAYGLELKDRFLWLEAWDMHRGSMERLSGEQCNFGYRNSIFKNKEKGRYIITHVTFRLKKKVELQLGYGHLEKVFRESGGTTPAQLRNVIIEIRRSKLPDPEECGNAGSFFKNPIIDFSLFEKLKERYPEIPHYPDKKDRVKIPAAWLIQQSGWKGKQEGKVGTWPHQPLVIVNYGGATGQEIYDFSSRIIFSIKEKFSISLEREVNIV